jgi:ZIP family zinc transporter
VTIGLLLGLSLLAALAAGVGAVLGARPWIARHAIGWAAAAAAGLMLGVGYVLLTAGQAIAPAATLLGAALGLCLMRLMDGLHGASLANPAAAPAGPASAPPSDAGLLLASGLHSGAEGLAIGAAASVGGPLAQFLLITLAIHNVSEGAVLGASLTECGWRASAAAAAAVVARASQPLLAVAVALLTRDQPALLPWCIGASFGALLYLIIAELLPQSYRQAGRTGIAVLVSLAAGMVALMGGAP